MKIHRRSMSVEEARARYPSLEEQSELFPALDGQEELPRLQPVDDEGNYAQLEAELAADPVRMREPELEPHQEPDTAPGQEHLDIEAEGKYRWAVATFWYRGELVTMRERIPLHVFHMDEGAKAHNLSLVARDLRKKVLKRMRGMG